MASIVSWGQYRYLTDSQAEALVEFLAKADPVKLEQSRYSAESPEQVGCRFLRARQFEVNRSLALLNEASEILYEYNAEKCAEDGAIVCTDCDEKIIKTFYPHAQQGFDRLGRLLLFEHNGHANIYALRHATTPQKLIKYHFWTMEKVLDDYFLRAPKDPRGNHAVSTLAICDFEGLGLGHLIPATFDHIKILIKLDNVCYPEMLGKMVIINAPGFCVGFFNMMKSWLDPRTQNKIEMLGSGPETTKRLLELVSKENLPAIYGGMAPNPFFTKPNTEYAAVPRAGELVETILVPVGMILHVTSVE